MQDDSIYRLLELKQNYHSFRLRAAAVRFVLDGAMESHTAAMLASYSDAGNNTGRLFWAPENYNAMVTLCDSGGFQISTHAAGDRAVRMALDAYENARKVNGWRDARFRVSQIEAVAPADLPRFARMGVIALMQPVRAGAGELDVLGRVAGPERMKLVFPWHSLEQAGARLIFSSGWPSPASPDPLRGIYAAATRNAAQRVGVETALRAYTVNGAYASFEDRMKGKLKAGMLADVAVLSQDIFSVSPEEIDKTKVDLTIFDGQVIFTR
ncbi:MAG: amidohydrolase, partial [Bryobacteraceae bacterium]